MSTGTAISLVNVFCASNNNVYCDAIELIYYTVMPSGMDIEFN